MKHLKNYAACLMLAALVNNSFTATAQTKPVPQLGKNSIKEVIAAMTLEEKATLVVGAGRAPKPKPAPGLKPGMSNGFVAAPPMIGKTENKVPGAAGNTAA